MRSRPPAFYAAGARALAALAAVIMVVLHAGAQPSGRFDVDAYRSFLNAHRDLSAAGLMQLYPAGRFSAGASVKLDSVLYADSIALKYQLTGHERSLLADHGFVVSERLSRMAMGDALLEIYDKDLPVFVSTDAILHAFHKSYDAILKETERAYLIPGLDSLLAGLHAQVPLLAQAYASVPGMRTMLQDVDLYLAIPRILLGAPASPAFAENTTAVTQLLGLIQQQGPAPYPLFAAARRNIDFSQFTPRGHYTESPELTRYFQAMIWLGRTEIYLRPPRSADLDQPSAEDIQRQVIDAVLVEEAARRANSYPALEKIERLLSFFVGEQDNVTLPNLRALLAETGVSRASDLLDTTRYEAFCTSLEEKSYAFQRILSQILMSDPLKPEQIRPASAFLLFGQRFVIDSYVTANVVYDRILFGEQKVRRMLPSTLDILFALGNNAAGVLLEPELTKYPYAQNLAALRYLVSSYEPAFWHQSIYNGWLNSLRTLNPPQHRALLPAFMQTAAWWQEKMNTQLASWAQLRHDNLLYAKQSYTGGVTCSFPLSYVEPIPAFYRAMRMLADSAVATFSSPLFSGVLNDGMAAYLFTGMSRTMDTLAVIAESELAGKPLTGAEKTFLSHMIFRRHEGCGVVYDGWYPRLYYGELSVDANGDVVVADVHTAPTDAAGSLVGWVLHAGTGPSNLAVVVAPRSGGGTAAYVGPVFSYYELLATGFKRLTDQEWTTAYAAAPSARPSFVNLYLADAGGNSRGSGLSLLTDVDEHSGPAGIPEEIALWQNYPNPFNPSTVISFQMAEAARVRLAVYDLLGRQVALLMEGVEPAGRHVVRFDGSSLASGMYLYKLETQERSLVRKMMLVK